MLVSCQRHSQWCYHHIPAKYPASDLTRLTYHSLDPIHGIDLEFLCSSKNCTTYLQIHSKSIPASEENPQKAQVLIQFENKTLYFLADRHCGGQRLRLSEPTQTELIALLKKGKPILLELKGYRETIDPKRFEKLFKRLYHPPYTLPFHPKMTARKPSPLGLGGSAAPFLRLYLK